MTAVNSRALAAEAKAAATAAAVAGSNWRLTWDRGQADVFATGGSLHNLVFRLDNGCAVAPLAEAPWIGDPSVGTDASIPAHLHQLGGEWACVPFGTAMVDPLHHGFGTDNAWHAVEQAADAITLAIDYPEHHPIKSLERRLIGVAGQAAIAIELTVEARTQCILPVGLHPIFRLPEEGRGMRLDPGPFVRGYTFPKVFEPGVSRLRPGAEFTSLDAVPLAGEGVADLSRPPADLREEILQLADVGGCVCIDYPDDGYRARLDWNADDFPSLVIWLSNRGRAAPPWSNSFRGIGIEPVNGFFDDTGLAFHAPADLALGRQFHAGERWTTHYRISASILAAPQHEGPTA
ncbi:hypothetical protein [Mesorhizobium sp. KR2-14]|uniref:hypothetical protein n=1 Tax=Mesorhizobium sp. KR2-14 TaxID=3156610 RepID=UPI0032B327DA